MDAQDILICQSCGMPLTEEVMGTNGDRTKNGEYCVYCFKDGQYAQDYTMDEMIDHCIQFLDEFNKDADKAYSKEEAIAGMKAYFPTLKRWRK